MYDSQVNSTEIQENVTGSFSSVSSGLTSEPMVRRKGLPEWAINWSRNRFGMDAGGVNLCIVDKQESDEAFAAASGNNIFVTSEYKNNKSVLMHEITHIYQQAVGSATESNVGDQSLEDEAVKVSNGEEVLLSKKQNLSDKYIVPRENTNIVQSFGGLTLGLLLGGIFLAGAVNLLTKHMKYKKIARETGVSIDCVKMVYKAFGWAEAKFCPYNFKELCKVVYDKNITWEKLKSDGESLKNNHGEDGIQRYIEDLKGEGSETVKEEKKVNENTGVNVAPQNNAEEHHEDKIPEPVLIEGDGTTITSEYTKDFKDATKVTIGNKVKDIGRFAFSGFKKLKEIQIPESVTTIGYNAFSDCYELEKVVLHNQLHTIGRSAFSCCKGLKEIEIPDGITEIYNNTFDFCSALNQIKLSHGLKKIGTSAFEFCKSLNNIDLPNGIEEIGSGAFGDCSSLKNMNVPSGIPQIGHDTFRNCKSIREANIPEGVQSIGDQAFENCTNLEKVSIPRSVESIGEYAFADCENLVAVNNFPKLCGKDAFLNCGKLNLPEGIDNGIKHHNVSDKNFIYKDDMEREKSLKVKSMNDMPLFSAGGPKMEDIQQGEIGDCWLVASLASIVKSDPKTIENIMKDNKDGTVDVTLQRESETGRFKKEVYTVEKSLIKRKWGLFGLTDNIMSRSKENIWVQMIEKAFSAYFAKGNEPINYYNITGGGGIGRDAFKIILGKEAKGSYDSKSLSGDRKELFERIKRALDSKIPLYYGIDKERDVVKDVDGDKVMAAHAFSLIGAEEKDGKYYIELRNPWGLNYGKYFREKGAIIKVDLEKATNVDFQIDNLGKK